MQAQPLLTSLACGYGQPPCILPSYLLSDIGEQQVKNSVPARFSLQPSPPQARESQEDLSFLTTQIAFLVWHLCNFKGTPWGLEHRSLQLAGCMPGMNRRVLGF